MKAVVYACGSMGAVAVRRLLDAGFYIPLAISEEEPGSSSVHELCGALNIPCMAPRDPNQFGWVERARKTRPDMLFCFNYPTLLKAQVLAVPKHGSFRLHRALLPEHRGPDPVRRAIMAGQRTTGVTLHELVVEPYGGGVVARQQVDIARDDTAASLEKRMEQAADAMLATVLPRMKALDFSISPQDLTAGSTHEVLTPEDGGISWDRPAEEIHNLIRAFARPFSGAFGLLGDEMVFFLRSAAVADCSLEPGVPGFREGTVLIGTGRGSLEPREIEVNGRVLTGPQLLAFFKEHAADTFQ